MGNGHLQSSPTVIHCDNQAALRLAKNPDDPGKNKHIDLRFHYIREQLKQGEIVLQYCPSAHNLADIFTKALPVQQFKILRERLSITDVTQR